MRTTIIISLQFSAVIAHLTVHKSLNEDGHKSTVENIAATFLVNPTPPVPWILSPTFPPMSYPTLPPQLYYTCIRPSYPMPRPACNIESYPMPRPVCSIEPEYCPRPQPWTVLRGCRLVFLLQGGKSQPDQSLRATDWEFRSYQTNSRLYCQNMPHSNFPGLAPLESNLGSHNKGLGSVQN